MANIDIIISGQASSASNSVDTLIGKLTELSNALNNIGNKAKTAFSNFGSGMNTNVFGGLTTSMNEASEASGTVRTEIKETTRSFESAGKSASKSAGMFGSLGKSIGRIAFYRAIRSAIKEVTEAVKEGIDNYYKWSQATSGPFAAAMDKLKSSASQMKNQLGAAFGSLATAIMPIVNLLVSALTRLAKVITMVFSLLGGRSTYDEAVGGFEQVEQSAGGAGKKVKGLLAAWDELNVIGQEKGGGGGGKLAESVEGLFEEKPIPTWLQEMWEKTTGLRESIERIKKLWNNLVERFEKGDFKLAIQLLFLDPLNAVLHLVENVMEMIEALLSGDFIKLGALGIKTVFDGWIDTYALPFARTIDSIFGTDISNYLLTGREIIDSEFSKLFSPETREKVVGKIKETFSNAWEKVKEIWNNVATWFDEKVVQPIVNFFRPIVEWLGSFFRGAWIIIKGIFMVAANWFNDKVWTPIKEFAVSAINVIRDAFISVWEKIKVPALNAVLWITEKIIEPTAIAFATAFDWVRTALAKVWYTIKSAFATAVNWIIENVINKIISVMNTIGPVFAKVTGDTWTDIKSLGTIAIESFDEIDSKSHQAADAVKNAFKGLKQVITDELSADPVINFHYNNAPSGSGKNANGPTAQLFAEGGYVTTGQLFVAREAGPEMVGSIGSHTAVANNDQIVAGIASGVREAESEQNALLRQQNAILAQLLSKELTISPSAALGQVVARSNALYARS